MSVDKQPTQSDKLDTLSESVQSLTFDSERVIKPAIQEIKELLHALPNGFISRDDVNSMNKDANNAHAGFDKRITILESSRSKNWIFNLLSGSGGALLFFFVQYVLTHH